MSKRLLVTAGLSDYKLKTKLKALVETDLVSTIFLVRRTPLEGAKKIHNICPPEWLRRNLFFFECWRFFTLLFVVMRYRIDLILAIQLVAHGIQARIVGWVTVRPTILSVIGNDIFIHCLSKKYGWILRFFVRKMDFVTAMGKASRQIIVNSGVPKTKIRIVQNEHSLRKFNKQAKRSWDLVFVGDLIVRKGVDTLLAACEKIDSLQMKILIVGDGPEREYLQRRASKIDHHTFHFTGHVADVETYLSSSKVMVLTSKIEALPAVAVESMIAGTPAILSNICDIPTFFKEDETCLLIPPDNPLQLATAIERLLQNQVLYQQLQSNTNHWVERYQRDWGLEAQMSVWKEIIEGTTGT